MGEKITVEVLVERERAAVWRFFHQPEHITQWNFASDDWCCPRAVNDLRAGGRLCARMEAKDGSFGFDFEAIYDEIVDGTRISYTMTDGRQAQTTFEDVGGSTRVRTRFDAESEHPLELQRDGWQAILENFKKYAESV